MNSLWIGIAVVIVSGVLIYIGFARPFDAQHSEESKLRAQVDSLLMQVKFAHEDTDRYKRYYEGVVIDLTNCRQSQMVNVVPTTTTDKDSLNVLAALRKAFAVRDSVEAERIAKALRPTTFNDPIGFTLDNPYVMVKVNAYGENRPLEGVTNVKYRLADFQLGEKQKVYVDKEYPPTYVYESFFYGKIGAGYNWRFRQAEIPAIVGLYANVSSVLAVDIQALSATYRGGNVDVASRALLQIRIH